MNIHLDPATIVIAWLVISGVTVVIRGLARSVREYTAVDAFLGAAEIALLVWMVTRI